MATIKFTSALNSFFPGLTDLEVDGESVVEVLDNVEKVHPGISAYLVESNGTLRKHINIFIEGKLISDRQHLSDEVRQGYKILIIQALSGG